MQVVWTPEARISRENAIDYIAQHNISAAIDQLDEIETQTDLLADHPEIGRPGRMKGTREMVINRTPFIAVYRIEGEMVQILELLHGAQQWPNENAPEKPVRKRTKKKDAK